MKKSILLFCAAALLVVTAGCGGRQKKAPSTASATAQQTINYPIPTAYEVTSLINRSGAAFVIGIANPVSRYDSYLTESKKAFALGVYGADLAYVSTYNMKQETLDYMKVVRSAVEDLEVSTNFNVALAKKIEDNIDNKDSLIMIISESFRDTYSFFMNSGKDDMSLFVLAGTWVEGLYITSQVAITSVRNEDMLQVVANQKESLDTLLGLIEVRASKNAELAQLLTDLAPIRREYDDITKGKVSTDEADQIFSVIEKIRDAAVK
ncbi:MAG: hypothetical protein LBK47_06480 [Prevotellaceae bacterium]|jgi:hypothetical protein|nr:hypothetical protein [Prevotellaceae bacterium]